MKENFESLSLGPKTVKNSMDIFKSFVRWVQRCKGIEVRNATLWPQVEWTEPKFKLLNAEDPKKIFENVFEEDRPFVAFMMLCGCRPAEASALKVEDVDLKSQIIRILATFSKEVCGKRGKAGGPSLMWVRSIRNCWNS